MTSQIPSSDPLCRDVAREPLLWAQRTHAVATTARAVISPFLALVAMLCSASHAGTIYTCVDAEGRKHSSGRPIPECAGVEQRVLNKDGSLQRVVPPATEGPIDPCIGARGARRGSDHVIPECVEPKPKHPHGDPHKDDLRDSKTKAT
jgi:hypothetical protein